MNLARALRRARSTPAEWQLWLRGSGQRRRFDELSNRFTDVYRRLDDGDTARFVTPMWEDANARLEKAFLPRPPANFLRQPLVARMMFVDAGGTWLRHQLDRLEARYDRPRLRSLLVEDAVGRPRLADLRYTTSHNSIHHTYHLERFAEAVGRPVESMDRVVEWGGGYGNLAKLVRRRMTSPQTYVCIDTPLFSALQWLYLSSIYGEEEVSVVAPGSKIVDRKINLVSLGGLSSIDVTGELFISTWALSESSAGAQDFVVENDWFGCSHLLLAYQQESGDPNFPLPAAPRVGDLARAKGAAIEEMSHLPGHHYAFL